MEDIREGFDEPYGGDVGFPGDGGSRLSKCESGASVDAEAGGKTDSPSVSGQEYQKSGALREFSGISMQQPQRY